MDPCRRDSPADGAAQESGVRGVAGDCRALVARSAPLICSKANMIVYLMRHGQADTGPEVERGLTEAGMEAARKVSLRCRAAGVSPALILTSTYRRAIQTAEIAAAALIRDGHRALPGAAAALLSLRCLGRRARAAAGRRCADRGSGQRSAQWRRSCWTRPRCSFGCRRRR